MRPLAGDAAGWLVVLMLVVQEGTDALAARVKCDRPSAVGWVNAAGL